MIKEKPQPSGFRLYKKHRLLVKRGYRKLGLPSEAEFVRIAIIEKAKSIGLC